MGPKSWSERRDAHGRQGGAGFVPSTMTAFRSMPRRWMPGVAMRTPSFGAPRRERSPSPVYGAGLLNRLGASPRGFESPPLRGAPVAQLDRASDYGSEGWGFESLSAHWV